ncbi:MAG: ComEC/Rec2 family competence protein [Eubacteriales bacterium]
MHYIKQHPGYFILGTFLICAAVGYYLPAEIKSVLFICAAVFTVLFAGTAFFIHVKHHKSCFPVVFITALFLCICAAFGSSFLYFNVTYAKANALAAAETETETEIEGIVLKNTYTSIYSGSYNIVIVRSGTNKVHIKAKLRTEYASDLNENERFIMKVRFESLDRDEPELLRYHLAEGFLLYAVSDNPDYKMFGDNGFSISYLFSRINAYTSEKIKLWVGDDEGKFISALALGNREDTPRELKRDVSRLGLTHILAVSGMHLAITLGILNYILSRLHIHRHIIYILLIIFSLLYMGITGFSPSVIRCAFMTMFYYLLLLSGERPDRVSSLFLSGAVICLINPPSVLDIGFILSFSATLGLITAGYMLRRTIVTTLDGDAPQFRIMRMLLLSLSSGVCALLFTMPFVWLFYGEISLVSPVMNLLFSPLASLILLLTPLFIAVSFIAPVGALIAAVLKLISYLFISTASFFAQGADYSVSLQYGFVKYIALLFAASVLLLALFKVKKIWLLFIPSFVGVTAFIVCLLCYNAAHDGFSYVCYYRYGLGDGIAVIDGGSLLVCDISDGSYRITGTGRDIGREYHAGEIDVYMLTHYHNRHINTFIKLTGETYIKTLCLPEPENDSEHHIYSILIKLAAEQNCAVTLYPREKDAAVLFGRMTIDIFPYTKIKRSPHPVICIGISDEDESAFYLGGAVYESVNADIADRYASSADVLIIGGHSPKLKTKFSPDCALCDFLYYSDSADMSYFSANRAGIPVADDHITITFSHD